MQVRSVPKFINERRIGEGVYGMVVEATNSETAERVAIKVNVKDASVHGIGSLRETDLLARANGHPYVINFLGVLIGSPDFKERPKSLKSRCFEMDSIHFVMSREENTLDYVIRRRRTMPYQYMKIIFAQIMIAIEWIHSRGIVHRDIKPANILISGTVSDPHVRLCDFGLGASIGGPSVTTPGAVTSWYRPPEICLGRPYNENVDIWSAAVVVFEMISKRALLYGTHDKNEDILVSIFRRLPSIASIETINRVNGGPVSGKADKLDAEARRYVFDESFTDEKRRADMSTRIRKALRLSASDVQLFSEESGGTVGEFCDLIAWMLSFDPIARPSATQVLGHPFFAWLGDFIASVRAAKPVEKTELPRISIYPCKERTNAVYLVSHLFNNRLNIGWYSHRVTFNAIDLFDRYLAHMFEQRGAPYPLHEDDDVYIRVYTCLYMFHKYFKTLSVPYLWGDFVPAKYDTEEYRKTSADFEIFLLRDVCDYRLYRDTLYEYLAHREGRERESQVRDFLVKLGAINSPWSDGSVRSLARFLQPETKLIF